MSRFARSLSTGGAEGSWKAAPPTPHDLRRTLATRAAELGVPGEDVRALLNHSRRDITGRHYDLYDRAREKRNALELWSQTLSGGFDLGHPSNRPLERRPGGLSVNPPDIEGSNRQLSAYPPISQLVA
jgi:hypothetical protein